MVGRRSRPDPVVSEYVQQRLAALLAETPARRAAPGPHDVPGGPDLGDPEPLEELPGAEEGGMPVRGPTRAEVPVAPDGERTGETVPPAEEGSPSGALTRLPFTRRHVAVVAIVVVLAAVVAGIALLRARPVAIATPTTTSSAVPSPGDLDPTPEGGATTAAETVPLLVHVLGEVRSPGVVELADGARVRDALAAAGGLTEQAVPGDLNLAQPLADGQQVVVSDEADDSGVRDSSGGPAGGGADPTGGGPGGDQLDLNAATEAQLLDLPGVGPVTAGRIVTWREQNGRFSRVEELQEVDGIGPKTFAQLAPLVRV